MKSPSLAAAALLLAAQLPSTPAAADVMFALTATGSSPAGVLQVSGSLALSNAAFASGVTISRRFFFGSQSTPPDLSGTGVTAIDFKAVEADAPPDASLNATYTDFAAGNPAVGPFWAVDLESSPGGIPTGQVLFNNTASDFTFALGSPASSGLFNSDAGNPASCGRTGVCQFAGTWRQVVPEPATIALLGFGFLSLLGIRQRARVRMAESPSRAFRCSDRADYSP